MFVRILSLIRLARVSRLVRFFNEVEKVSLASKGFYSFHLFILPTDMIKWKMTEVSFGFKQRLFTFLSHEPFPVSFNLPP